jgi:anti-anti-sigma factor
MYGGALSRVSCPRCGLDIRLRASELNFDRCPRCYAHSGVVVPINGGPTPTDPALPAGSRQLPRSTTTFGHLMITTERQEDMVVLALYGNLDMASEACLSQALRRAYNFGCKRLVIDLSALEFIDWTGLQVLLRARRETLARGGSLSLLRGPRAVQRLFELTGADDLFSFED